MGEVLIWCLSKHAGDVALVELELFAGRNKYTKKGLYSGPIRRQINGLADDSALSYLLTLPGAAMVASNKFTLTLPALQALTEMLVADGVDSLYFRGDDKRLHHVAKIAATKLATFSYDENSGVLYLPGKELAAVARSELGEPRPVLYFSVAAKGLRALLNFRYGDSEIAASSKQTEFRASTVVTLRNMVAEEGFAAVLLDLGFTPSYRNEYTLKRLTEEMVARLEQVGFALYAGSATGKKPLKRGAVTTNISYDIDWFSVDGAVQVGDSSYTLADVLAAGKGDFVELGDTAILMPPGLNRLRAMSSAEENILIPKNRLLEMNEAAESLGVDISSYLERLRRYHLERLTDITGLEVRLLDYQLDGVSWIYSWYRERMGCCLADDMGLGKTIQAIAFIEYIRATAQAPILIVVPKIVLYNWSAELARVAPRIKYRLLYGLDFTLATEAGMVYITTYETVVNKLAELAAIHYEVVIIDEAQYIKNANSKRYQALRALQADFRLALSGTQIENNLLELWAQMNFLNPGLLGSRERFVQRYVSGDRELTTLRQTVEPFLLRRRKEDKLKNLPPKNEQYITCRMEKNQRAIYDELMRLTRNELAAGVSRFRIKDNARILEAFLYLREACTDPALLPLALQSVASAESCKYEMFKLYAAKIACEQKLVVFSQFPRYSSITSWWLIALRKRCSS